MIIRIAVLVLVTVVFVCAAEPDEIGRMIAGAISKHDREVAALKKALVNQLYDEISKAAQSRDLERVRRTSAMIESFSKNGELPPLKPIRSQYVEQRKRHAKQLYEAYQSAIAAYAKAVNVDRAAALKRQMENWIVKEKAALDGKPVPIAPKVVAGQINQRAPVQKELEPVRQLLERTAAAIKELHQSKGTTIQRSTRYREIRDEFAKSLDALGELTITLTVRDVSFQQAGFFANEKAHYAIKCNVIEPPTWSRKRTGLRTAFYSTVRLLPKHPFAEEAQKLSVGDQLAATGKLTVGKDAPYTAPGIKFDEAPMRVYLVFTGTKYRRLPKAAKPKNAP